MNMRDLAEMAMNATQTPAPIRVFSGWMLLMLGLDLAWEVAHLPLYRIAADADPALTVVHCTLGDGMIAAAAYAIAAMGLRSRSWPIDRPLLGALTVVVATVAYTAFSELRNLGAGNWQYASAMPTVLGIGLSPLLQWVAIPICATWIVRLLARRKPSGLPENGKP